MEPKSQTKSARTRLRILESAARVFRQNGYAATSLRDIASAARMKAGSLYYHFDDKEELVAEVLDIGVRGAQRAAKKAVDDLGAGAPPTERLRAALRSHLRFILSESDFASANLRILRDVPAHVRDKHLARQRAYGRFLAALFADVARSRGANPAIDLSVVRMLCLGALNWSIEWYRKDRLSPDEIVDQLVTMLERGILAPSAAAAHPAPRVPSGRRGKPRQVRRA
jgi:AcrR family transcriptional regulator